VTGPVRGAALGLAAFGIFATHDVLVKTLGGAYAPFQIVFFSVLFSFPLASLMLLQDDAKRDLRPVHPWWTGFRTASVVATSACAFYAFSTLPLAQVYAILFAAPLVITVLSIPMLGETVRLRRWLAVLAGLVGVAIVLRPWGGADLGPGHLAALVAACLGAFSSVVVRKIGRDERPVVLLLYPLVANFVAMGALLPLVYRPMPLEDLGLVALVAALSFGATLMLITAYRSAPATLVAPMQYSQIVWAAAYGAIFFGEVPDGMTVLGAGVIIASGLYILFRESRASQVQPNLRTRARMATPGAPRVGRYLRGRPGLPAGAGLSGVPGRSVRPEAHYLGDDRPDPG
jgi:drug/metabolite transporter (DMT)-like permease